MEYLKKRQQIKRRLYSKTTIVVFLALFLLLLRPTWNIYKKSQESKQNLRQAQMELDALKTRKSELEHDLAYVKSQPGFDQEIRDKFGVAKKDETMIVIVRDQNEKKPAPPPPPETFWTRLKAMFGLK